MLRHVIRKVRLFGLHLVPLDIREDARLMRSALDELFRAYGQTDNYLGLPKPTSRRCSTARFIIRARVPD